MTTSASEYAALLAEIQNSNITTYTTVPTTEPRFSINANTRAIEVPSEFTFLGVRNDHKAETIYFEIDRYFDDVDLSEHTCVIQFLNKNASETKEGVYPVTTIDVDSVDGKIVFGWNICNDATQLSGDIVFSVRFYSIDENGLFTYNFNTLSASSIILETLNTADSSEIITSSELEIWNAKMESMASVIENDIKTVEEKIEELENSIASIPEDYTALTEELSQLSLEIVEINETLSNGFDITNCELRETIELGNVIDGYVKNTGSAVTSGDTGGYAVTETPITLLKGETICIFAKCIPNVALIATYKAEWYGMTPLLLGNGGDKQIYEYTPQENIDVVISYHKNSGCEVYRKIAGNDVIECIKDTKELKANVDFAKIFHKIGGIGDSLMSGEIARWTENGDEYIDRYNFSWLSNIARDIGAEYVHYSQGGMTAKAWVNDSGGFKSSLLAETNKCSAYFIGLCTNDWKQSYPLGTINDNAGTDSFVGYYKQIVETVKAHNPNAVIFLVSAYTNSEKGILYSNMIASIADLYSNCYYIDFVNNTDIYTNDGVYANYSHFTTLGYVKVADTIHSLVNKVIKENANTNFFKFFALNNE